MTPDTHDPIRLATIQTYLFGRAIRRLARDAEAELEARGIPRRRDPLYGGLMPALDQLAEIENES